MVIDKKTTIEYSDFDKVEIRVGKILQVELIEDSKYSTHKVILDFGPEIGEKKSCARLVNYQLEQLVGKMVVAVLNFHEKQIGKNMSEVLILGVPGENGECFLLTPDENVPLGGKMY